MCKQTRAHTYEEKDSRTLGRNEEIKVWPLSAALISSCRLYLLNLLFLALVPSPDGVQPRANPLAPSTVIRHSTVRCFAFRTPTRFVSFSSRPSNRIGNWIQPSQVTEDRSEPNRCVFLLFIGFGEFPGTGRKRIGGARLSG